MPFHIVRNDITKMHVDAIVNTANPKPIIGAGTDWAVYHAAGAEQLLKDRQKIGAIAKGDIAVTGAYQLEAKYIIHAVGPLWQGGNHGEFDILRSCYEKSLQKAVELGCESIAFPLMATGSYGFPKDQALNIAANTITSFVLQHELTVYLVVFSDEAFQLSSKLYAQVESYIDTLFVQSAYEMEYQAREELELADLSPDEIRVLEEKKQNARNEVREQRKRTHREASKNVPESIHKMLEDIGEMKPMSFGQLLLEYMIRKNMDDTDVYKAANMDRRLFNKIKNSKDGKPKKKNALAICIGMKLTLDETKDLLACAGYALNPYDMFDCVVQAYIELKIYDWGRINSTLFARKLDTF